MLFPLEKGRLAHFPLASDEALGSSRQIQKAADNPLAILPRDVDDEVEMPLDLCFDGSQTEACVGAYLPALPAIAGVPEQA